MILYLLSEIGGKKASAIPNREIGFGFVSCSCRACVRAKLCERVREVLLNAGASDGKKYDSGGDFNFSYLDDSYMGFKVFFLGSMLYAWAF